MASHQPAYPQLHPIRATRSPDRGGDVVFVHGVDGHHRRTWLRRPANTFWPEWLAEERPDVDVYSLGFPLASSEWRGTAVHLQDRALTILQALDLEGLGDKPLCFIAHSMGGLVVKQMLRSADGEAPEYQRFSENTAGILFLATPHTGSDLAPLRDFVKFLVRPTVAIKELEPDAAYLRGLNYWYRRHAHRSAIRTRALFELHPTNGVFVVGASAADPGINDLTPIGVDADHIGIAKPDSPASPVYREARRLVDEAILTWQERTGGDAHLILPRVTAQNLEAFDQALKRFMTAGLVCRHAAEEMSSLVEDDTALKGLAQELETPSQLARIDHNEVTLIQLDAPDVFDLYAGIYHTTFERMILGISLRKHYLLTEGSRKANEEIPPERIMRLAREVVDKTQELRDAIRRHRTRLGLALS